MSIQLDNETKNHVSNVFAKMEKTVKVHLFTSQNNCMYCNETREILKILQELAPEGKIDLIEHDFDQEQDLAKEMGIDKAPAIIFEGERLYHMKYFGIPSGYEFGSVVEDIVDVSLGKPSGLSEEAIEKIKTITKPVKIMVFVTPTCPYCPRAVRLAHQAALVNENISGEMIEAMEFQELSMQYNVMGVPKLVFNEKVQIEGAPPEPMFLDKLFQALD